MPAEVRNVTAAFDEYDRATEHMTPTERVRFEVEMEAKYGTRG